MKLCASAAPWQLSDTHKHEDGTAQDQYTERNAELIKKGKLYRFLEDAWVEGIKHVDKYTCHEKILYSSGFGQLCIPFSSDSHCAHCCLCESRMGLDRASYLGRESNNPGWLYYLHPFLEGGT